MNDIKINLQQNSCFFSSSHFPPYSHLVIVTFFLYSHIANLLVSLYFQSHFFTVFTNCSLTYDLPMTYDLYSNYYEIKKKR